MPLKFRENLFKILFKDNNCFFESVMIIRVFFLSLIVTAACDSKHAFDHQFFSIGKSNGLIDNSQINEASGLAASETNPGTLWTHNDSGNKPQIFLIDSEGKHLATVNFPYLTNRDWEDIAVGPGPETGASYVYIGDVGDNFGQHELKYIYRLKEPRIKAQRKPLSIEIIEVDSVKFKLPDGNRDSEAIMIDPLNKDIFVFSKREESVNLYLLPYPQSTTETMTAQFVSQIPFTQINAAAISPEGNEILIKNYIHVYYWRRQKNETIKDALKRKPFAPPYITEPQGEAITFDRNGKGYFTLSEKTNGRTPHLMFYQRKN
jgi:hypothetical protein